MQIIDKYPEISRIIRTLAYNVFHNEYPAIKDVFTFMNTIRDELPELKISHIRESIQNEMFAHYNTLIEYYTKICKNTDEARGGYMGREYMKKPLLDIKHTIICDIFVNQDAFSMNEDKFFKIYTDKYSYLSADEIKSLYKDYHNIYWFCKGLLNAYRDKLSPKFMFEKLAIH